ncbi:MAG: hypothetical protein HFF76_04990, partial [Oscillospiraceae bacterium]|nr:hypothetical protein [Oscillospiraceae bacterium]
MVIDGEERVLNVVSGLEDIGKSVRMYVRPQSGTTRYDMVTDDVYATELNKVYDSFASVSSVGNSTASSEGITSIAGAEHYINYDYVTRWTARMRITYVMDLEWTQYQAYAMRRDNGGSLYKYQANATTPPFGGEIGVVSGTDSSDTTIGTDRSQWNTRLEQNGPTYTYVKTISLDDELTQQDWDNLKAIFTDADKVSNWLNGEVYVGTASYTATDDISDEIRWEDFIATYLKNEETRQQVESNGLGNRLIIIDNDNDGIAEYVLQTIYTIGKVVPNGSSKTLSAVESKFNHTSDKVNIVSQDDDLVSVSGKELAASENVLNVDDVVIYAKIDGNLRAQLAETVTGRVTAINRASSTATLDNEIGEKKQSAVHPHADGLASGVANMVIGTNYTVYYDLDGNLAAFVEGNVGSFVLITDGWYNQAVNAREYAVQAYIDGRLQNVNVTNNGSLFIGDATSNNAWGRLRTGFGNSTINNGGGDFVRTIVANIEDGNLIPVDKSYRVSQRVAMLDMVNNAIPTRDGSACGNVYNTTYSLSSIAYNDPVDDNANNGGKGYEVLGRSDTVYYYVHNIGKTVNGQNNYVVRTYTGYNNIPAVDPSYIEDVYAVGIQAGATIANDRNARYYTAEVVVVELNEKYLDSRVTSEQVFIPSTGFVSGNIQGVGLEQVEMIRGNGAVETVWVDMRQSNVRSYEVTGTSAGTTTSRAGMYFMDPIGTTTDGEVTYKIVSMEPSHIRANNYLAGYVSQTNVTNDHVRVDMQVPGNDAHGCPVNATNINNIVARQGATITASSKLYKLGYNGSGVPTLNGDLTAAEVFYRNPDPNVTNTVGEKTNEMWNHTSGLFDLEPRNEVLVRYDDNGNVIWAISFREFRSVSGNVGTRDSFAQDAWYQALPAAQDNVTSNTKFLGKSTLDADSGDGTALHPYKITMSHEVALKAQETNNIIDVAADVGTVVTYKLEWWNGTNWVEIPRNQINDVKPANETGEQRYQLTITLNQGEPRVYILVKEAAKTGAKLESTPASNIDKANKLINLPLNGFPTIAAYLDQFKATENGYIVWNITLDGAVKTWDSRTAKPSEFNLRNTDDIQYITATVYNEGQTLSDGEFYQGGKVVDPIANAAIKAAEDLIPAGVSSTDITDALNAIKDGINRNKSSAEALMIYLKSSAYATLVQDLKDAVAAAQKTQVKLATLSAPASGIFSNFKTSAGVPITTTEISLASGDLTVTFDVKPTINSTANTGDYLFTISNGTVTKEMGTVTVLASGNTTGTVSVSGLTSGVWTIDCRQVQTAPLTGTVSFVDADSGSTISNRDAFVYLAADAAKNPMASVTMVPGQAFEFCVAYPADYDVISVRVSGVLTTTTTGTYVFTPAKTATGAHNIVVTLQVKGAAEEVQRENAAITEAVNKLGGGAAQNSGVNEALTELNQATTAVQAQAAKAKLARALTGVSSDNSADTVAVYDPKVAGANDGNNIREDGATPLNGTRAALSEDVMIAQVGSTKYVCGAVTPITTTSNLSPDVKSALAYIWYGYTVLDAAGDKDTKIDNIVSTIFSALNASEGGDADKFGSETNNTKFAYVLAEINGVYQQVIVYGADEGNIKCSTGATNGNINVSKLTWN